MYLAGKPLRETSVNLPLIQNLLPFKLVSAIKYFIIPYSYLKDRGVF